MEISWKGNKMQIVLNRFCKEIEVLSPIECIYKTKAMEVTALNCAIYICI